MELEHIIRIYRSMRLSSLIAIVIPLIFSVVGVWSFSDGGPLKKGFGAVSRSPQASNNVPVPKVLEPSKGTSKLAIEKFLMMYTCKVCSGRNAQMVIYCNSSLLRLH